MNKHDFENKSFDELIDDLLENVESIMSYNTLKDYAISLIDEDDLLCAIHILNALFDDDAEWYDYETSMGTLQTPTGLTCKEDIAHYFYFED